MADYVVERPRPVVLPVRGGGFFPVRRVYCVGRNYAEHAREMGNDERDPPFFFSKPADALVISGDSAPYPSSTSDLHHEIELVVAIGKGGEDIDPELALDHVYGYAVGIDLTRRDLQSQAKKAGRPWDMSKGFDHSAPIGDIVSAAEIGHPGRGAITLSVNGAERQRGDLAEQLWPVNDTISFLSRLVALRPGDLIFTGTPAGVGPIVRGDVLEGVIEGVGTVRTSIG